MLLTETWVIKKLAISDSIYFYPFRSVNVESFPICHFAKMAQSSLFHQTQLPAGGDWYGGLLNHYTNRLENSFVKDNNKVAKHWWLTCS